MKKVYLVNPHLVFCENIPNIPIYERKRYYDNTEINMTNYLEILPSIALYGFKYAIEVNRSYKVLNGDFRVLVARELNILIPIVILKGNRQEEEIYLIFLIKTILRRRIVKRNSFLRKKFPNPFFNRKNNNAKLLCKFQKNIFIK